MVSSGGGDTGSHRSIPFGSGILLNVGLPREDTDLASLPVFEQWLYECSENGVRTIFDRIPEREKKAPSPEKVVTAAPPASNSSSHVEIETMASSLDDAEKIGASAEAKDDDAPALKKRKRARKHQSKEKEETAEAKKQKEAASFRKGLKGNTIGGAAKIVDGKYAGLPIKLMEPSNELLKPGKEGDLAKKFAEDGFLLLKKIVDGNSASDACAAALERFNQENAEGAKVDTSSFKILRETTGKKRLRHGLNDTSNVGDLEGEKLERGLIDSPAVLDCLKKLCKGTNGHFTATLLRQE